MLLTLLSLVSLSCPWPAGQGQEQESKGPDPERVAAAVERIDAARRGSDAEELSRALEQARDLPHPDVVKSVARLLEDPAPGRTLLGITTLRWIEHPGALEALEKYAGKREWRKDPEAASALMYALGQHGSPSSIRTLSRNPFDPPVHAVVKARVLALGHIRSRESVEALIEMLGTLTGTGPRAERRLAGWMSDVRLSLVVLTAVDQGQTPEAWERWWRESRKSFEIAPELPTLPREMRERWSRLWGLPVYQGKNPRREDRGDDTPPGR